MAVANPKSIPTRAQWKKLRDASGGKSGLCKKVNVGKHLDKYHKLRTNKEITQGLQVLLEAFVTYGATVKKDKNLKDLWVSVNNITKLIKTEQLALKQNKDVGLAVGLKIVDGTKRIAAIVALLKKDDVDGAGMLYEKFWDGIGRGVGQQLAGTVPGKNWEKAHGMAPTRANVSSASGDDKENLIKQGLVIYKKSLADLMKDAKKAGYELKLS